MTEYRRKTLRSFYCEEVLWKAIEKLARDKDATIDVLLNEAIQRYVDGPAEAGAPAAIAAPLAAPAPVAVAAPIVAPIAPAPIAPAPIAAPVASPFAAVPAPAVPRPVSAEAATQHMPAIRPPAPPPPPPPPRPTAPQPVAQPQATGPVGTRRLFLHYAGKSYPVAKDEFVIGRGSTGTDLTIRDANVSRRHAVINIRNGQFIMQDLGSTNGVEMGGVRIDQRLIEEGDTFTICDHELSFSYRG